jgi:hypothetical protein
MIDLERARELLVRAVETQGRDFVYNPSGLGECSYTRALFGSPGQPQCITGCLIGVALDLAGETRHHGYMAGVASLRAAFPDMMTQDAASYFRVAQWRQDSGGTWGQAYDAAEASLRMSRKEIEILMTGGTT